MNTCFRVKGITEVTALQALTSNKTALPASRAGVLKNEQP